jgi:hypothetical protein
MLIEGEKFHGTTSYVEKHNILRTIAGSSSWFTEIKPIRFPAILTFHRLLFHFIDTVCALLYQETLPLS